MKTFSLKQKEISKKWFLIDAEGQVLGRLATQVATILRGKNKPTYTPHLDCGDNVVIVNAAKVAFKGSKKDKKYYRYSGYPGGLKETSLDKVLESNPERAVTAAVKGMLGKGPLGRRQLKNLRVYAGADHEQSAQQPEKFELSK